LEDSGVEGDTRQAVNADPPNNSMEPTRPAQCRGLRAIIALGGRAAHLEAVRHRLAPMMARITEGAKSKGSQHWLQSLANHHSDAFDRAVHSSDLGQIRWLSPLETDSFAEYQDQAFLDLVGVKLESLPLTSFWPARGPVWDGLALTSLGALLMVEAKANLPELQSPPSHASPRSASLIRASLGRAKPSFGAPEDADWMSVYYQYANRLAWLHLLRAENGIPAYLVFLYFSGASEVNGPMSPSGWKSAIQQAHRSLKLGSGLLSPYVLEAFVDVADLADA